eukprot:2730871-Rhodomonas_salina.1
MFPVAVVYMFKDVYCCFHPFLHSHNKEMDCLEWRYPFGYEQALLTNAHDVKTLESSRSMSRVYIARSRVLFSLYLANRHGASVRSVVSEMDDHFGDWKSDAFSSDAEVAYVRTHFHSPYASNTDLVSSFWVRVICRAIRGRMGGIRGWVNGGDKTLARFFDDEGPNAVAIRKRFVRGWHRFITIRDAEKLHAGASESRDDDNVSSSSRVLKQIRKVLNRDQNILAHVELMKPNSGVGSE